MVPWLLLTLAHSNQQNRVQIQMVSVLLWFCFLQCSVVSLAVYSGTLGFSILMKFVLVVSLGRPIDPPPSSGVNQAPT